MWGVLNFFRSLDYQSERKLLINPMVIIQQPLLHLIYCTTKCGDSAVLYAIFTLLGDKGLMATEKGGM